LSETFCPLPWNFQAIRANGDIRICCQANISAHRGILKKTDGGNFNAAQDSLKEARNAKLMKEVRLKMLKGEWHENCQRCRQEEESGLVSRRVYEQERWELRQEDVEPLTQADGSIDVHKSPVVFYDLRFGNLCNLKCRMCGPADSSAWYEDWVALEGKTFFKDTSGRIELEKQGDRYKTGAYDWHFSQKFWDEFESHIGSIKYVYMAGGEPLLIKRHYDFLEKCVDQGLAKEMVLEYNTNCTQLPAKALQLWSQFKQVRVGASIDGYGAVAEYQRFPSRWNEVYLNLKKLDEQPRNIVSWLAFTVTAYNIFHIVDFMKWKLKESGFKRINSTKRRPIITHHVAHNPKYLNVRVLPKGLKMEVKKEFQDFKEWMKDQRLEDHVQTQGYSIVNSIESYMESEDYYPEHWGKFCSYTLDLDRIRGNDILSINPQMESFLVR
jgi:hypothetical protein